MTIFVSIVSYRDPLLIPTMRTAVQTARWPDELHFGIVNQSTVCPKPASGARISYVRIEPEFARGPCFARSIAMSLYDGEDWFFQIDSHMHFDKHWDKRLIEQAKLFTGQRNIVLSSYPNPFILENGIVVTKPVTREVLYHVVKPGASFTDEHLMLPFEAHPRAGTNPFVGFHLAAGCLFAPGSFVQHFPYDPYFYFHGEEQALALRLFTHGWNIFHPFDLPIYHLYNTPNNSSRPLHWSEHEWWNLEQRSRKRMDALVRGEPLGVYGLGTVRSIHEYAIFSGIDYRARTLRN